MDRDQNRGNGEKANRKKKYKAREEIRMATKKGEEKDVEKRQWMEEVVRCCW